MLTIGNYKEEAFLKTSMRLDIKSHSTETKSIESRKHPRLDIDLGTLILFDFQDNEQQFLHKALILDASFGGCGIITVSKDPKRLQKNSICYIKAPELSSIIIIKTKIVWVKETENNVFRLGLQYFEEQR